MDGHDWTQYPPSQALGSQGWIVVEECGDGSQIEAFVLADKERPVTVRRVVLGPRRGIHQCIIGDAEGMREEIRVLRHLIEVADRLEALR